MMGLVNRHNSGTGRSSSLWPVLLVFLLAVLVPVGCVLWFMAAAMRSESLAVRQRLADVYREKMLAAQKDLDEAWDATLRALWAERPGMPPARLFASLAADQMSQSVVLFGQKGARVYPVDPVADDRRLPDGDPGWDKAVRLEMQEGASAEAARAFAAFADQTQSMDFQAQALQGQSRCLLKLGNKQEALAVLTGALAAGNLRYAMDPSGRLIAPAAQLLALQLMGGPSDRRFTPLYERLTDLLGDYAIPMPATQRRFLMHSLVELGQSPLAWNTLAAEDLAAEYLAAEQPPPEPGRLNRTKTPGVWQIGSADRIALYREQWIIDRFREVLTRHGSPGMSLVLRPPGEASARESQPFLSTWATRYLPGWTLEVQLTGVDPFAAAISRQRAAYLWTGGAGIVAIAVLAVMVASFIGRQMRLTRLKNDLIATVSHELKTPLASMRMLVDTLLEGRYRDAQQVTEYLQLIAKENQRLSRLIDNFLTFSRMERNKRTFEFAPVRIEQVVATAIEAVGERFRGPGCRLAVEVPPDLPVVEGDRDALTTAVLNLLDNAWKYTGDEKCVVLRGYASDGAVVLEVRDNGAGIPRRAQRRIFDRFYQVDQSLSRKAGGCGLGLSIVQFVVTAHGGMVSVASEPGKGSIFTVRLPATERQTRRHGEGETRSKDREGEERQRAGQPPRQRQG